MNLYYNDTPNSRGEKSFIGLPNFGAKLYDRLTQANAIKSQFQEIADDLISKMEDGRLLDIGTGPGRLLLKLHELNPDIELFGFDISESMIQRAKIILTDIKTDLRTGNIQSTDYEDNFFDIVTCTGSFYLWDNPVNCLNEIHRILKEGKSAYLYESHKDFDENEFQIALNSNLEKENLVRRIITPFFLKKQIRMTYHILEVEKIISESKFANSYVIEKITLSRLPIWARITLPKGKCVQPALKMT